MTVNTSLPGPAAPLIVIGGGVGPMAGVALHKKIIEATPTSGRDQEHLSVMHLSFSPLIPDRTGYLLGEETENPGRAMADLVSRSLISIGSVSSDIRIGVPCNTFHADGIFPAFREHLEQIWGPNGRLRVVHMLKAAMNRIQKEIPAGSTMGVLSTTGTRRTGLWRRALEDGGYRVVEPTEAEQENVHNLIYNREWGLKAVSPPAGRAVELFSRYVARLEEKGAAGIILGCSELPLARPEDWTGIPLIDPVECLAEALVTGEN